MLAKLAHKGKTAGLLTLGLEFLSLSLFHHFFILPRDCLLQAHSTLPMRHLQQTLRLTWRPSCDTFTEHLLFARQALGNGVQEEKETGSMHSGNSCCSRGDRRSQIQRQLLEREKSVDRGLETTWMGNKTAVLDSVARDRLSKETSEETRRKQSKTQKPSKTSPWEESKIKRTEALLQRVWDGSRSPHYTQPKWLYHRCSKSLTEKHRYGVNTESFILTHHNKDGVSTEVSHQEAKTGLLLSHSSTYIHKTGLHRQTRRRGHPCLQDPRTTASKPAEHCQQRLPLTTHSVRCLT